MLLPRRTRATTNQQPSDRNPNVVDSLQDVVDALSDAELLSPSLVCLSIRFLDRSTPTGLGTSRRLCRISLCRSGSNACLHPQWVGPTLPLRHRLPISLRRQSNHAPYPLSSS